MSGDSSPGSQVITYASYIRKEQVSHNKMTLSIQYNTDKTYDGDLSAEVSLDISCFDSIWRIFCDHLVEVWESRLQ